MVSFKPCSNGTVRGTRMFRRPGCIERSSRLSVGLAESQTMRPLKACQLRDKVREILNADFHSGADIDRL